MFDHPLVEILAHLYLVAILFTPKSINKWTAAVWRFDPILAQESLQLSASVYKNKIETLIYVRESSSMDDHP